MATFAENQKRWGLTKALYVAVMDRLAATLGINAFLINARPLNPNPPVTDIPPDDEIRYLRYEELSSVCANADLEMSEAMARSAMNRGDRCIGYFEDGRLVSYFWCGFNATPAEAGLWVRIPKGYAYAYKALTLASHRGRRLQNLLTHESERWLSLNGYRFNIEYIATHNFAQRRASRRYGNRTVGVAGYARICARVFPFRTPSVKRLHFEFFLP